MTGQGIERQRRGTNGVRHSRDSSCRSYVETVASGTDSLLECRIASYIVFVLLMRLDLVAFVRRTPPRINTSVTLSSGRVHLNRPTDRPTDRSIDRSIGISSAKIDSRNPDGIGSAPFRPSITSNRSASARILPSTVRNSFELR